MKKAIVILGLLALFLCPIQSFSSDPKVLSGTSVVLSSSVTSFTVPNGASSALIGVVGGTIRYYINGSNPSSTDGMTLDDGEYIALDGRDLAVRFKTTLNSGATGVTVYVTFFAN